MYLIEDAQLAIAPDHRRPEPFQSAVLLGHRVEQGLRDERGHVADTLRFNVPRGAVPHSTLGESLGHASDEDLAWLGRRLQPLREVHRDARDHPLVGAVGAGDGLAGVHADPHLERQRAARAGDRVADRERGAHAALGVIVVGRRDAEHGHHGVADELLDGPAVRTDDGRDPLERGVHDRLHDLRVVRAGQRGRSNDVREQDRHELALFRHGSLLP
jgi:hypothetical protein